MRAQSVHDRADQRRGVDRARRRRALPGATSITSSTMRFRRSTLSATMRVSCCCSAVDRVFRQQRVGLRDRRQRVADLVRDAGRHAAHRRQLLLPQARLHVAQVLEEQHAELLGRRRLPARAGGA